MTQYTSRHQSDHAAHYQENPAQQLTEDYQNPRHRPEAGPKDIWAADSTWDASQGRIEAQIRRHTGRRDLTLDRKLEAAGELAMEPGAVRANCFAHDAMLSHRSDLIALAHSGEAAAPFAERHGSNWGPTYEKLVNSAEAAILTGKFMVADGLHHDDSTVTAAGTKAMQTAVQDFSKALRDDAAADQLLARDAGWNSNWKGPGTNPATHVTDRIAVIDADARQIGPGGVYAEAAAATYLGTATAHLDAAAMTNGLETAMHTLQGQNQAPVETLTGIAVGRFNAEHFPEIKEAADALGAQGQYDATLAYTRMGQAEEAFAAAAFVMSNCPEKAGLAAGQYDADSSASRLLGDVHQLHHDPANGTEWAAEQIRETLNHDLWQLAHGNPDSSSMELPTAHTLAQLCEESRMEMCVEIAWQHPDWEQFRSTTAT